MVLLYSKLGGADTNPVGALGDKHCSNSFAEMNLSYEMVLNPAKHYTHVSYSASYILEVLIRFLNRVTCAKKNINVKGLQAALVWTKLYSSIPQEWWMGSGSGAYKENWRDSLCLQNVHMFSHKAPQDIVCRWVL